jgi:outer membrane lipoprotein-sorting protein
VSETAQRRTSLGRRGLPGALAAALFVASGCTSPVAVFPKPKPSIADSALAARDLLARLGARYGKLKSFKALAEMDYEGNGDRLHVAEAVVVERPDRLRIEMMSPFGVALQIACDGRRLFAYHRGEKTFYGGGATADNLSRFTRLPLQARDVADLLVGLPPGRERRGRSRIEFEEPTDLWRVTAPLADSGLQILWFDRERLLPVRTEEVDRDGSRRYLTRYADYREIAGIDIPHEIELEIPAEDTKVRLTYSGIELNGKVSASLFRFQPPPGSRQVDLDRPDASS